MDRLVSVDVKELELFFKPSSDRCSATFRVANLMHTMSVAISLTTATPHYSFGPHSLSVIPPLSSSTFSLYLSPATTSPPPPDSVLLRSTMLPTGRANTDALRRIFSARGTHIFRDASLPISLVGPHVVKSLISSSSSSVTSSSSSSSSSPQSTKTLETAFVLSKALSRCSVPEISSLLVDTARAGNPRFVSHLIDAGADHDFRAADGDSALSIAVKSGNVEIVRALIAAGSRFDPLSDRFLHAAAASNDVVMLSVLTASRNVNSVDSRGRAAMHESAACGHVEAIRFFVDSGGDPNFSDPAGWTPLHCAASEGHLPAVELLLDCAPFTKYAMTKEGKTPFMLAVDRAHIHLLDLLRLGDSLHRAAGLGDIHGVRNCLSQGAKVNGRDQNGWTPLHRAAFKGRIESVKLLIESGAQVDAADDTGYTPLHCAVEAGQADVALCLITHGAITNPKHSSKGAPPLNLPCFSDHGMASLYVEPESLEV